MWSKYLHTLAAVAVQLQWGQAQALLYGDSSGCVDPLGFKSCMSGAYDTYNECIGNCTYNWDICNSPCECLEAQHKINCAATHCWNEVYSCQYQDTVGQLLYTCRDDFDLDQIPFFPAPDDVPGGCSCNSEIVAKKQRLIRIQIEECGTNSTNADHLSEKELGWYLRACQCCSMSALIASIYDTCPNTDPAANTFPYWNRLFSQFEFDACGPILQTYDCANTLGFGTEAAGGTENFYKPGNIPENGTEPFTNNNGTNPISTPLSGSTFTWTFGSSTYPITAAASTVATTSATDVSHTSGQGPLETGRGESAAPLSSRSSVWCLAVVGFCIAFGGF